MAYGTKLFADFREVANNGRSGTPWQYRLVFREENYAGAATEIFTMKERGIKISVSEGGGALGLFQAINTRKMTIKVLAKENWDPRSLYVNSDRQIQVVLQRSQTGAVDSYVDYFYSWLLPAGFKEKYGRKPYAVEVSASCGLSTLKDRPLVDADGKRLTGLVSLSHVLRTALAQTGFNLPMVVIANLYHQGDIAVGQTVNGRVAIERCPLFQTRINADAFLNDDGTTQTAYQTIERILEPMGLRVAQENSVWYIARSEEMAGGWITPNAPTALGHIYGSPTVSVAPDGNGTYNFNHTVYPDQALRAVKGGTVQLNPTVAGIKIEQAYGSYINKLPNGDFGNIDSNGFPVGWSSNGLATSGSLRPQVLGGGTEIDPHKLVIYGAGDEKFTNLTPWVSISMNYPVGSLERIKSMSRTLTGQFELQNTRAAKIVVLAVRQVANKAPEVNILQAGGTWKANPSAKERVGILIYHSQTIGGVVRTKTGEAKIDLPMDPIDNVAQLAVFLCQAEALDAPVDGVQPFVKYKNIRLESTIEGNDIQGRQVTIQNRKAKVETTLSVSVGDVADAALPYDRVSTYFTRQDGPVTAMRFYKPYADFLSNSPTPDDIGRPLINWLADSYARQALQPVETFEDEILGRLPYGLFTVLRFPDIGPTVSGAVVPSPFLLTRWDFYPRECRHEVTAVELKSGALPVGATPTNEWQTPNGPILIEPDGSTPTISQPSRIIDKINAAIAAGVGFDTIQVKPYMSQTEKILAGSGGILLTAFNPQTSAKQYIESRLLKIQSVKLPQ